MTDNETVGRDIEDIRRLRRKIDCLESKAERICKDIAIVADILRNDGPISREGDNLVINDPDNPTATMQVAWPSAEDIAAIYGEKAGATADLKPIENRYSDIIPTKAAR